MKSLLRRVSVDPTKFELIVGDSSYGDFSVDRLNGILDIIGTDDEVNLEDITEIDPKIIEIDGSALDLLRQWKKESAKFPDDLMNNAYRASKMIARSKLFSQEAMRLQMQGQVALPQVWQLLGDKANDFASLGGVYLGRAYTRYGFGPWRQGRQVMLMVRDHPKHRGALEFYASSGDKEFQSQVFNGADGIDERFRFSNDARDPTDVRRLIDEAFTSTSIASIDKAFGRDDDDEDDDDLILRSYGLVKADGGTLTKLIDNARALVRMMEDTSPQALVGGFIDQVRALSELDYFFWRFKRTFLDKKGAWILISSDYSQYVKGYRIEVIEAHLHSWVAHFYGRLVPEDNPSDLSIESQLYSAHWLVENIIIENLKIFIMDYDVTHEALIFISEQAPVELPYKGVADDYALGHYGEDPIQVGPTEGILSLVGGLWKMKKIDNFVKEFKRRQLSGRRIWLRINGRIDRILKRGNVIEINPSRRVSPDKFSGSLFDKEFGFKGSSPVKREFNWEVLWVINNLVEDKLLMFDGDLNITGNVVRYLKTSSPVKLPYSIGATGIIKMLLGN